MTRIVNHTVKAGDTLPNISQKYLGDSSQWIQIATFNSLDYPFIDTVSYPGLNVKRPGDTLSIPVLVEDDQTVQSAQDRDSIILGRDMTLVDGDLVVDDTGDISMVSGIDCLYQDLMHALQVTFGTLPHHPEFGSRIEASVGNRSSRYWIDKAAVEVVRTFKSNPRVLDVKDVQVTSSNTDVRIRCSVVTQLGSLNIDDHI